MYWQTHNHTCTHLWLSPSRNNSSQSYGGGAGEQAQGGSGDLQKMDSSRRRVTECRMTDAFPRVQSQRCRPRTLKRSPHRLHLAHGRLIERGLTSFPQGRVDPGEVKCFLSVCFLSEGFHIRDKQANQTSDASG